MRRNGALPGSVPHPREPVRVGGTAAGEQHSARRIGHEAVVGREGLWRHRPRGYRLADDAARLQIGQAVVADADDFCGRVAGTHETGGTHFGAFTLAMAGTEVLMAPTSLLMVHNPLTVAIGDSEEMQKAIAMLDEVKESIITAYELKTGMSRAKLAHLMDAETWMNAQKAMELGFADGMLSRDTALPEDIPLNSYQFSRRAVTNTLLSKIPKTEHKHPSEPLYQRLNLLKK